MRTIAIVLLAAASLPGQETDELGDAAAQARWLEEHGQPPAAYVAACFEGHDVVLLGEHHLIRENAGFVAELIPVLDAAGVGVLASEFVRTSQTEAVRELVTAPKFDEAAGIAILRELPSPWGHREYLDILRAVQAVNAAKDEDAPRFVVLGLDDEWSQAERFRNDDQTAAMRANLAREQNMVDVMRREVFEKDRKALVHLGWAHSVTCHGVRLGTVLRKEYGDRVFQVALHHDLAKPITARIEALCAERGGDAVGFDVVGSPFASMRDASAMPFQMVRGATLKSFGEGWVFLKPVAELRRTSWIEGFIDAAHFEDARFVAEKMRWIEPGSCETPEELDARLAARFDGR